MPNRSIWRLFSCCLFVVVFGSSFIFAASAPQFLFNRADFPTGQTPTAIAIADFNADGIADVAVANEGDNTVSILLGQSDGTLGPKTDFPTADAPFALAASDLNGDGKPDLVVVSTEGVASVFLGNGDGTFSAHVDYPTGVGSNGLVIVDFNGDHVPDLATVDFCGTNCGFISVLLGKGDGTFLPKTDYAVGASNSIVAQDFNRDGKMDLAVATASNTISVLLGNGDGTFQSPIDSPSNDSPIGLAAGDFNGDKIPDLIVSHSGAPWPLTILIGKGDGTFQPEQQFGTPSAVYDTYNLAAADLNGDGKLDLVITDVSQGGAGVFLGNGDGTFQTEVIYTSGGYPTAFEMQDINGDGSLDLAIANQYSNTITVFLGNGDGSFSPRTPLPFGPVQIVQTNPASAVSGDFNGDGIPDIAIGEGNEYGMGSVTVLLGKGKGAFKAPISTNSNGAQGVIAAADFNGDGKLDVALSNGNGAAVLLGNGDGSFGAPLQVVTTQANPARSLVVGDFNDDGKEDLIVLGNGFVQTQPIFVVLGNGDGTFQSPKQFWNSTSIPIQMAAGDFNHDGKLDIVITLNPSGIAVMLGKGDGTFQAPITYATDSIPNGLAVADLNHDGIPDIVATATQIDVFLGNGDGTFSNEVSYNGGWDPFEVATGDFNHDGKVDIAVAAEGTAANGCLEILLGNGDGTFEPPIEMVSGGTGLLAVADLNQDGTDDVVATGYPGAIFLSGPLATLSPTSLNFGSLDVSTPSPARSVTLANSGNGLLNLSSIAGSAAYSATDNCGDSLAAFSSCIIDVTFTPTSVNSNAGTLTITDNAPQGTQKVALLGAGLDFSVTAASSSMTLARGAQGTDVITFATVGGSFDNTVQLTCSVNGPAPAPTCSLSPSSVTPGQAPVTSTLTVTAPSAAATMHLSSLPWLSGRTLLVWCVSTILLTFAAPQARKRLPVYAVFSQIMLLLVLASACGGSSGGGLKGSNYDVTVTASCGALQHTVTVSVSVP